MSDAPELSEAQQAVASLLRIPPGTRFNNYQLERFLGHGAMGAALLARDLVLGRPVVVKVMLGHAASDPRLLERFRREAMAGALIESDHVVKVFEAGRISGLAELQGAPFIGMQYVDGASIDDVAKGYPGRIPPRTAAGLVLGIARGLVAAHAAGIIHRDVKPGNALLCRDGRVKLADFGLAKFLRGPNGAPPPPDITQPGMSVGTPLYIAPEQAQGDPLDGRADVYALGVSFYELLTKTFPFQGSTMIETLSLRFTNDPKPLRQIVPDLPPEFEQACLTLLEREPAKRPTAKDAVTILQRLAGGDPADELAQLFFNPSTSTQLDQAAVPAKTYSLDKKSGGEDVKPTFLGLSAASKTSKSVPASSSSAASAATTPAPAPRKGKSLLPAALFALGSFFLAASGIAVAFILRPAAPAASPPTRETAPRLLADAIASRRAENVRAAGDVLRAAPPFEGSAGLVAAAVDAQRLVSALAIETQDIDKGQPVDALLDALAKRTVDDDVKAAAMLVAAVDRKRVPASLVLSPEGGGAARERLARVLAALGAERPASR